MGALSGRDFRMESPFLLAMLTRERHDIQPVPSTDTARNSFLVVSFGVRLMRLVLMRWFAIACATLRCPPAAGLRPPPRPPMSSYSTRDQFVEYWSRYKAAWEVYAPGSEYRDLPDESEELKAAYSVAYDRRVEMGLTPRFQVTVPPLPASELFDRNAADVAGAGWALFQVACSDACGRFEAMPESASVQEPGPCDHNGGAIPASRAGLEELAALPHGEYAKLDGVEREHEAAGALWYRLKEDGRRLQEEGELCEAEETLERAERAEAAYKSLGDEAYQQLLDVYCRAGWAGKYMWTDSEASMLPGPRWRKAAPNCLARAKTRPPWRSSRGANSSKHSACR